MSAQSIAKEKQGYVPRPRMCSNCRHFASEIIPSNRTVNGWYVKPRETNLRCTLGNFAVKKMGTCNEWSGK